MLAVRLGQSEHLTPTKAHQRRGFRYFDPVCSQILQHAHPVDLRPAHRNHRHRPKTPQPKPWRVTSLSGPTVTSLSGVYNVTSPIECYGILQSSRPAGHDRQIKLVSNPFPSLGTQVRRRCARWTQPSAMVKTKCSESFSP